MVSTLIQRINAGEEARFAVVLDNLVSLCVSATTHIKISTSSGLDNAIMYGRPWERVMILHPDLYDRGSRSLLVVVSNRDVSPTDVLLTTYTQVSNLHL